MLVEWSAKPKEYYETLIPVPQVSQNTNIYHYVNKNLGFKLLCYFDNHYSYSLCCYYYGRRRIVTPQEPEMLHVANVRNVKSCKFSIPIKILYNYRMFYNFNQDNYRKSCASVMCVYVG